MTAEQRAGLSDAALAMTQPCIDELIKDISRRVQKAGAITDTAEYQIYRAQALGEGKKAIEQAVSKQIGISEEVIASLFEYVADKSLSPDENGSLKRMTEAYTRMTQSKTRELLRDLWADTPDGKVQPLQTAYARAMDFAFRQVATGTLDLNTAISRAVTPLAKRGLRTIEQKSGAALALSTPAGGTSWTNSASWMMKSSTPTMTRWGATAGKSVPTPPAPPTMSRYRGGSTATQNLKN